MANFLTAVLSWLLGAFTRLLAFGAAHFAATKIILVALFMVTLPIILNNVLYSLMDTVFSAVTDYASGKDTGLETVANFTGLAAYMLNSLGLVDAFAVILSCMGIRFAISWIPFVGPK